MAARRVVSVAAVSVFVALLSLSGGCQLTASVSSRKLIASQALIDFSGLKGPELVPKIKTLISPPQSWEALAIRNTPLYSHQQWRSPSTHTGVGVVCAHLPLPLSVQTITWLAKQQYSRQSGGAEVLNEWTDEAGRSWFEAETDKYHVTGYIIVDGLTAWFVYFGYRVKYPPELGEISVAARSARTAVPLLDGTPTTRPATSGSTGESVSRLTSP